MCSDLPATLFATPWTPFPHHGLTHVRIWQRVTPFGIFQRHEWRREGGGVWLDAWISSPSKRVSSNAAPVLWEEPAPAESLEAALQMIAAGHNDPRALAQAVLDRLGYLTAAHHG